MHTLRNESAGEVGLPLTGSRPRALSRRRRILIVLIALAVAQLMCALVVGPGFWVGQAAADVLLLGYVVHLRREVQRARGRRARELARTQRRLAEEAREREAVRPVPAYAQAAPPPAHLRESASREVVIEKAEDGSWHPVPVPVPTYVTAPPAPGMPGAPVTPSRTGRSDEEQDLSADTGDGYGRRKVVNE